MREKSCNCRLHILLFLKGNSGRAGSLLDVCCAVAAAYKKTPSYKYSRSLFPEAFPNTRCIIFAEGVRADPILYYGLKAEKADAILVICRRITFFCRKEFLGCLRVLVLFCIIWESRFQSFKGSGFLGTRKLNSVVFLTLSYSRFSVRLELYFKICVRILF